ncbi:MAG TPA: hypothetical protein VNY51_13010 [Candidatus Dormibacteraeota bacterium]|jgi:hypothetical protein|nr:hypothetical protein [Candidatus Dormibacteraeota bacterium]
MDAILKLSMGLVLEGISVDSENKAVLLGQAGLLSPARQLVLAQEAGDWQGVANANIQLHLAECFVADCHWTAMQWACELTGGTAVNSPP